VAEYRIIVRVDTTDVGPGTREVEERLVKVENAADSARDALGRLFALFGAALGVGALVAMADSYTELTNRIRPLTSGTKDLAKAMTGLQQVANETRSSFQGTAEIYSRMANAGKELGLSQKEVLNFTKSLNQAVILSGASSEEAAAGLMQLGQGLGSGALQGDELRSVLEQLPQVADVIADSLGVTRGELRKLGSEGKISAETVIKAFREAETDLNDRFAKTVPTISQGFTVMNNNLFATVGAFNASSGAGESFARVLLALSDHVETFMRVMAAAAIVMAVNFAQKGIGTAITAIRTFTLAMAANPIGAMIVAVTIIIALLTTFSDEITYGKDSLVTLQDFGLAAFALLGEAIGEFVEFFQANFGGISDYAGEVFGDMDVTVQGVLTFAAMIVDKYIGLWVGGYTAIIVAFKGLPDAIADIFYRGLNYAIGQLEDFANTALGLLNAIREALGQDIVSVSFARVKNPSTGAARNLGRAVKEGFLEGFNQTVVSETLVKVNKKADEMSAARRAAADAPDEITGANAADAVRNPTETGGGGGKGKGKDITTFRELEQALMVENQLLHLNSEERTRRLAIMEMEDELGRTLTETELERTVALLDQNAELERQSQIIESINGPAEQLRKNVLALTEAHDRGAISGRDYARAMEDILTQQRNLRIESGEGTFADGFTSQLEQMTGSVTSFSSSVGAQFGTVFTQLSDGFANSIGKGIFQTDQLGESLKAVARDAISSLVTGLIQIGIQYLVNEAMALTALGTTTAASTAAAAVTTAAWTPAAAAVSLASFGANAAPASAGISTTFAVILALVAGVAGLALGSAFANGGYVSGRGGSKSDSINARLSNGEYVVNAAATRSNRALLERLNSGMPVNTGSANGMNVTIMTPDADSFRASESQSTATLARMQRRASRRNRA
jgi:tape measure domain-containing protein